ncbi:Importin-9 [Bienertia sinuspersici]
MFDLSIGVLLLEEIISSCGEHGIYAILDAARRRYMESQQQKADGYNFWWRVTNIREAVIYAMASLSDQLQEAEVCGPDAFDLKKFIEEMIMEDIGAGVHECPYLYARVFSSVPKFSSMLSTGVVEHFLFASLRAVGMDVPSPVKVGSCRVLSQLLSETNKEALQPHILQLFSSLIDLLNQASEESLLLVLETLQAAVNSGHDAFLSVEPVISPIILTTWASHVSDPFISIDAIEVLEGGAWGFLGSIVFTNGFGDVQQAEFEKVVLVMVIDGWGWRKIGFGGLGWRGAFGGWSGCKGGGWVGGRLGNGGR